MGYIARPRPMMPQKVKSDSEMIAQRFRELSGLTKPPKSTMKESLIKEALISDAKNKGFGSLTDTLWGLMSDADKIKLDAIDNAKNALYSTFMPQIRSDSTASYMDTIPTIDSIILDLNSKNKNKEEKLPEQFKPFY